MVTPRTGRPPGPLPKSFRGDDDRFAVALLDVLGVLTDAKAHTRARAVASLLIGREVKPPPRTSKNYPNLVATTRDKLRGPGIAASFEGRADTLEKKRKKWRNDPAWEPWRQAMVRAFLVVFLERDRARARAQALWLASPAGEAEYAREVLWPMITASDLPGIHPSDKQKNM
jgi:hypothetical protein